MRLYSECTIIIYANHPKETFKGNFTAGQKGLFGSSPLRSDGSQKSQVEAWTSKEAAKGTQS
jgi:hypothetical protein